jgi:hypothetical protein
MTTQGKIETYLRAILAADDLDAAQREARLALGVLRKGGGK